MKLPMVKMATTHIPRGNGNTKADVMAPQSILRENEPSTLESRLPKAHEEAVMRHVRALLKKLYKKDDSENASNAILGITMKLYNSKYYENEVTKELLSKKPQVVGPETSTLIKTLETANAFGDASNAVRFLSGMEEVLSRMTSHKPNEPLTRLVLDRTNNLTRMYIDMGKEGAAVELVSKVLPTNAQHLENPSRMLDIVEVFAKDLSNARQNGGTIGLRV